MSRGMQEFVRTPASVFEIGSLFDGRDGRIFHDIRENDQLCEQFVEIDVDR